MATKQDPLADDLIAGEPAIPVDHQWIRKLVRFFSLRPVKVIVVVVWAWVMGLRTLLQHDDGGSQAAPWEDDYRDYTHTFWTLGKVFVGEIDLDFAGAEYEVCGAHDLCLTAALEATPKAVVVVRYCSCASSTLSFDGGLCCSRWCRRCSLFI